PVSKELEQHGSLSSTALLDRTLARREYGQQIVAVHGGPAEAIGARTIRNAWIPHHELDARGSAIEIVLTHENHRQVPDRGHVHRLVESALRHRAITEEGRNDLPLLPQLE